MIQRRHKSYAPYIYHESSKNGCPIGSVSNKYTASKKSRFCACISSRITTVIQITSDHQINYNCFNEPFAVSTCKDLYWDMHGLIFETSIWLLAGSTRFLSESEQCRSTTQIFKVTSYFNRIGRLNLDRNPDWAKFLFHNATRYQTLMTWGG